MKFSKVLVLAFIAMSILWSCQSTDDDFAPTTYTPEESNILSKKLNLPDAPFSYGFGNIKANTQTDHIATLGRVLFYDSNLSADGKVSCASCHQQALAFSDNRAFSIGVHGNLTERNSIALGSLRSFGIHYDHSSLNQEVPGLFWDNRAASIKAQLKQTINNSNEMGMELQDIVDFVQSSEEYDILHQKAFSGSEVTEDHILESLETFINSINSKNSKFETEVITNLNYISGDYVTGESPLADGFNLFIQNCNSCHNISSRLLDEERTPERVLVANNGLSPQRSDLGVYGHTQRQEDIGKFKVPGLQNVELTAPYMHDGRFETLEEVVDFYSSGINSHANLHPLLMEDGHAKQLNFTTGEKTALVDFLKSLTDIQMIEDEKWSDPFRY